MKTKEEKRIYVIVAETVRAGSKTVLQPKGRQIAQACHVTSLMRIKEHIRKPAPIKSITTIILSVDNSYQLAFYALQLADAGIHVDAFYDTNPAAYGSGEIRMAICTVPVKPGRVRDILKQLPLWGSE